jgi:hypothetical protein
MFHMRQFSAAAVLVQAICSTSRQFKTMQKLKSTLHVLQDLTRNHLKNSGAESAGFLFAWRRFLGFDFGIALQTCSTITQSFLVPLVRDFANKKSICFFVPVLFLLPLLPTNGWVPKFNHTPLA